MPHTHKNKDTQLITDPITSKNQRNPLTFLALAMQLKVKNHKFPLMT